MVACFALTALGLVALACFMAAPDALLTAAPFLLVFGLLLCGRFIGEERILACDRARHAPRVRSVRSSWSRRDARPIATIRERAPRSLRAPPALAF